MDNKMVMEEMTIMELFKVLGSRVNMTLRDDLTPEERQTENEQSALIMNIGKQMINATDLVLRSDKLKAQTRSLVENRVDRLIGE